jgi:hypothetical protein
MNTTLGTYVEQIKVSSLNKNARKMGKFQCGFNETLNSTKLHLQKNVIHNYKDICLIKRRTKSLHLMPYTDSILLKQSLIHNMKILL